jgi:hypothetical protein
VDEFTKDAAISLARRTSRRSVLGKTARAIAGLSFAGSAVQLAGPVTAAHAEPPLQVGLWELVETAQMAAIEAESEAWFAQRGQRCCYCWTNCNSCGPGRLARIYDCPCSGGAQQQNVRIVCTNRCCDAQTGC